MDRVVDRIGFLYRNYRPEYLFWDVVETVRKLYLVAVIAFFVKGSLIQLVLSMFVSAIAMAYHFYAMPFRDRGLNVLQGTCLSLIWVTFQCGLLMMNTLPDPTSGTAFLYLVVLANIVLMVSPPIIVGLAFLRCLPRPWRLRIWVFLGIEPPSGDGVPRTSTSSAFVSDAGLAANKSLDGGGGGGADDEVDVPREFPASGDGVAIEMGEMRSDAPLPAVLESDVESVDAAHRQEALLALPDMHGWNFNLMIAPEPRASSTMSADDAAARIQALEHQLALATLNQHAVQELAGSASATR